MNERKPCQQNEEISLWMSLALDGLVDADTHFRFEQHLAACSACQAEWHAMQRLSALIDNEPLAGPPLGFAVRVERRLAERVEKRRRLFGGVAFLTSSFWLAGLAVATLLAVVLGVALWLLMGSQPALQQEGNAVLQVASGLSLLGKGASLFLRDLLVRYGLPLALVLGVGLAVLSGLWAWLFSRHGGETRRNGYA